MGARILEPPVPAGKYTGQFVAETKPDSPGKHGAYVKLEFEITEGEHDGKRVSVLANDRWTSHTKLFDFAQQIKGSEVVTNEAFDFEDYIGTHGEISVEVKGEYSNVTGFKKLAEVNF